MDLRKLSDLLDCKLIFRTPDGEYEGILKLILVQKQRVTFEHTYHLPSREYLGTMHLMICDILSYKLIEQSKKILDVSKFLPVAKELLKGGLEKSSKIDKSAIVDDINVYFCEHLPSHLRNKCPDDYCLIDSTSCASFSRAINDISELKTVGVSFHGPELSRYGKLSWVCIATPICVFLFDIDNMGIRAFNYGLREIFQDENIEKVIHDCRQPADCLTHLFKTKLKNVFDTQVADYLINMQMYTGEEIFKYVISLDSCLVKYLKVPQQFLYNRNKCASKDAEIQFFNVRPISDEFKNVLIKSALYLGVLKETQELLLLYPFHQAVDIYLNVLRKATEAEVFIVPDVFSQTAPSYLSASVKSIRFYDMPLPPDDTVNQFKNTLHGREVWRRRMLMEGRKET